MTPVSHGQPVVFEPATVVAYDVLYVRALLRDCTPRSLLTQIAAGQFASDLPAAQHDHLVSLLRGWDERALGRLPLRDALMVDEQNATILYNLLCQASTVQHVVLNPPTTPPLADALQHQRAVALSPNDLHHPELAPLAMLARARGLALACYLGSVPHYPPPAGLDSLLPPPPAAFADEPVRFVQPSGRRWLIALVLVLSGLGLALLTLVPGVLPLRPAGVPLGLLTLGLMVGIRARWTGYVGALLLWLVPNLPSFHYGASPVTLWYLIPIVLVGLLFLATDSQVRALWRWLRDRLLPRPNPHAPSPGD